MTVPEVDPVLLRGLTEQRLGRRDLLKILGGTAGAAALAGCGIPAQGTKVDTSPAAIEAFWSKQKPTKSVVWANWPLYIDTAGKNDHPTIDQFTKASGVKVKYVEAIQDNGPFFAKVQPTLSSGQYSGFDVAVITSGIYFNKFKELGFFVPLDQSKLTNFRKHAGTRFRKEAYDPGNVFSIPWQAGLTGIGYNPERTGKKITSWQDLMDPKLKGHIGMMANNEDLPNCALMAIGVDPQKSTAVDWQKAADWLDQLKPLVRQFFSQNYINGLATGDIWVSMAWSGDIFQQNLSGKAVGQNLEFVIPEEGGLLWTDNFTILNGARNAVSAMELMDFYYQPKVAAQVTEWVNYISPVPAAQAVVRQDAAHATGDDKDYLDAVARSFATFPDESIYAKTSNGYTPRSGKELDTWNSIFEPVYQS